MKDAGEAAFLLDFDGDDEAVAADGDELVLGVAFFRETAERGAEGILDEAVLSKLFAANAGEFGAGVVVECAVGEEFVLDGFGEGEQGAGERLGEFTQVGNACGQSGGRGVDGLAPVGLLKGEAGDGDEVGRV